MDLNLMDLDWRICSRARLSRDARFDGKFYVGVLTTGIYCRPICRAPTAQEKNVRYFSTAAEAAAAGLRPCLRCRPECAPGTPAWMGTRTTVARALRLISESGLEEGGIEALATRLGIGSRHLRRLFLKHLGATPKAVADTRRLHFAKKLIDETSLPMTQVALASGFGCVRRFNASIRKVYGRTPSQIRRLSRSTPPREENQYLFTLRYRPPYNWQAVQDFLATRAVAGIEVVEEGVYRRSIGMNGGVGYFEVTNDSANDALTVRLQFEDPRSIFFIIERVRAMFDLNADWTAIVKALRADPALRGLVEANPGMRVPGCWSGFELAVRAILEQHSLPSDAAHWASQIVRRFGQPVAKRWSLTHLFPMPEALAQANLDEMGLPTERAMAIRSLAQAVTRRELGFDVVDSDSLPTRLRKLPGFSEWITEYVAMRALSEPDALVSTDLSLQRALALPNARELERQAERWRPWRAYAAMYLWDPRFKAHFRAQRSAKAIGSEASLREVATVTS
jgi:AraC family transcriptional regulator, regulatory protein of adaptative response / DNA-3-methyladenine glycosylase II